ncbi:MAG TPA: DUF1499 domain-containing protein [Stellaceae bacterium]|nr:DUF1499 domain-containing protein [Stellaceae bacterium]
MARGIGIGIVVAVLALVAAAVGLRLAMERPAEARLRPGEDVSIASLRGPIPSNAFLACPPHYCPHARAAASPVFAVDADRLYWRVVRLATRAPRVTIIADDPRRRRVVLIQRSALFRFPDIVIAEIVPLGSGRSSLALYSRARYGRDDFGVNRRRVERWLARLAAPAGP